MIGFRRRGGALLAGLSSGALLVGGLAMAAPARVPPTPIPASTVAARVALPTTVALPALPVVPLPSRAPATTPPATQTAATTSERPPPPTTTTRRAPTAGGPAATVVVLTNAARVDAGCAPLRTDPRITAAAQHHSEDMSADRYFSHDSRDGRDFADRITEAGYPSPGAENIAQGQRSAAEVVQAWLDSPGHRRNIEDCSLTTIGVGLAGADFYWTQDFGR